MKHTRKLLALAVLIACAVAACGDGSGDGGGGGYGGGIGGGGGGGGGGSEPQLLDGILPGISSNVTGSAIGTAMNERFQAAQTGTIKFYPIVHEGIADTQGGVAFKKQLIYGVTPRMGFIIQTNSDNLFMWGESTGMASQAQIIIFQVLVIRKSDGTGWVSTEYSRSYTYYPSDARYETFTIKNLTQQQLANETALRGSGTAAQPDYWVYIIVKSTTAIMNESWVTGNNLNTIDAPINYSGMNVIQVYPTPYEN